MSRFRLVGNNIQCTFHAVEYDLLLTLYADLAGCVTAADPNDRRFRRLFPPQVLGSDATSSPSVNEGLLEWREQSLQAANRWLHSATRHRGIYRLMVARDDVDQVLQLINDMRLMLGASIDIDAFDRDALPPEDERQHALAVIDHLAWWQEELLTLLDDDPDD